MNHQINQCLVLILYYTIIGDAKYGIYGHFQSQNAWFIYNLWILNIYYHFNTKLMHQYYQQNGSQTNILSF